MNTTVPTMMREQPDEYGELRVTLGTQSTQPNSAAPIEIRDENMKLVQRAGSDDLVKLSAGIYQISAVLQDGIEHRRIAKVKPLAICEVELVANESIPEEQVPEQVHMTPRVKPTAAMEPPRTQLPELEGAIVVGGGTSEWRLRGADVTNSVPHATIHLDHATWRISLPLNRDDGECLLRIATNHRSAPLRAWIAPERTTPRALQNMLLKGEYAALIPVTEQAVELLRSKYQDPSGASLGALILHKVGGLAPYADWLENLADDFDWLPDSKVFLASLLVDDHQQLDRALDLALSAGKKRLLFAETHSILLDMLRRWPGRTMTEPHRAEIDALARLGAYIDSTSLFLCHSIRE
jgi:hypothetical protein